MNTSRLIVLGIAAVAAGGAAFLARGMLGGGTEKATASIPPPVATEGVLVAATDLAPGRLLTPDEVRWQKWPKNSVDPSFMTEQTTPDISAALKGTVVRAPMVAGEPLTATKVVHADPASAMAAALEPGMRAVSITVSITSVAGGFIKPNDRVDLVLTSQIPGGDRHFRSSTILKDVRVLAIDQASDAKDTNKPVSDVKTVTLELAPDQAEHVARAQASGTLSLALRSLIEHAPTTAQAGQDRVLAARDKYKNQSETAETGETSVSVIRYGVVHADSQSRGE
jgi:pilus assembly protein CpaB